MEDHQKKDDDDDRLKMRAEGADIDYVSLDRENMRKKKVWLLLVSNVTRHSNGLGFPFH